ncbi:MAG TPA: caspase family protein, partial [Chloroflexia bacterium]|nr:caspase family protein [Chloroflexia bacterium]
MTSPVSGATPASASQKYALLIGIDAYQNVSPSLHGCVNDVLALRRFLMEKAGTPAENIHLLISPFSDNTAALALGTMPLPTKQNIKDAFAQVEGRLHKGDRVVVYYAGHGVRIANPANPRENVGAIVPTDATWAGTSFLVNRDLNEAINRLVKKDARVTVIFDSCHSGGATRDLAPDSPDAPAVRELRLDPAKLDWQVVLAENGMDAAAVEQEGTRALGEGSGWVPSLAQGKELIVVAGCLDVQLSHEYRPPGSDEKHGALTYFLLENLKTTDPGRARALLWSDIYPRIRAGVQGVFADQSPTLEGAPERPVFEGDWQPYAPGFTVSTVNGTLTLNGGTMHGLGPGAEVEIYPPRTVQLRREQNPGVEPVRAAIDSADAATSQAHVISPLGAPVADDSRAALVKPSTATPKLAVKLNGVPDAVVAGIRGAFEAGSFLDLAPAGRPPLVEVRSSRPFDGKDGWVIVQYRSNEQALSTDDVIAYAPPLAEVVRQDPAVLGAMLGAGLVHWARYLAIKNRQNLNSALGGQVQVDVLVSNDFAALRAAGTTQPIRKANAAGQVVVTDKEFVLLKVSQTSTQRLNAVILLCSDDGNIDLWWPTGTENQIDPGKERMVGLNGPNPLSLPVRRDQKTSAYTVKLFASDAAHKFDAPSLAL